MARTTNRPARTTQTAQPTQETQATQAIQDGGKDKARRGRAAMRTFAPLPEGALTHSKVDESAFVNFSTEDSRSDDQKRIDTDVENTYKAWVEAGRPEFTRASLSRPGCPAPRERYAFPPEHTEAIQYLLDRAGQLYGLNVVKSPISRDDNGNAVIHWSVKDRASRPRKAEDKAEDKSEDKAEDKSENKASQDQASEPVPDTE